MIHPIYPGVPAPVAGCLETCRRISEFLDDVGEDRFSAPIGHSGTIGEHLRHCLEHYQCFVNGMATGRFEYDARARDLRLETNVDAFRQALDDVTRRLAAVSNAALAKPVKVVQYVSPDGTVAELDSTFGRELVFLSSHAIHHLAVVGQLARELGVEVREELTLAFSTAAHRAATA